MSLLASEKYTEFQKKIYRMINMASVEIDVSRLYIIAWFCRRFYNNVVDDMHIPILLSYQAHTL